MSSPFIGLSCIFWLIGFTNYPGGSHYPLSYRSIKKAKIVLNFAYLDPFQYGFALLKRSDDVPINRRDHFFDESINFMLKSTVHNDPTLEIYGRLFICQPQKNIYLLDDPSCGKVKLLFNDKETTNLIFSWSHSCGPIPIQNRYNDWTYLMFSAVSKATITNS